MSTTSTTVPGNYTTIQEVPDDQKFNGENFASFKSVIIPLGKLKGIHLYWEGKIINPNNVPSPYPADRPATSIYDTAPNPSEFELRKAIVYLTLWNDICNPSRLGILASLMSQALWQRMEEEFKEVGVLAKQRKEDTLRACHYKGGRIAGEGGYTEKMRLLLKDARDCGTTVTDAQFNTIFLDSFPRSSDWVVITGTLMGQTSFSMIVTRLEEFYLHMNPEATTITPVPDTTYTALMAKIDSLEKAMSATNISKPSGRSQGRGLRNPHLWCTNQLCVDNNCTQGHTLDICWQPGGGKEGQFPPNFRSKR
ncbi:hypothetical protein L218DRAFT_865602, partial [Marasmius fiardii PR-910]